MAIAALGFIAADPTLLPRFLAITGIEAQAIRNAAREPGFLAGVLQFIVAHEPTLIAFAEHAGIEPAAVLKAMRCPAARRRQLRGIDVSLPRLR